MMSTGGWLSSWMLFFLFSLLLVTVAESSDLSHLPSTIVNCIDVDLNEIEELRLYLQKSLPLENIEDEAFGLFKTDWLRLKSLENRLPSDSKLKSRLTKAFRILIYALYEAHGQHLHAYNGTMLGNNYPNINPQYVNKTTEKVFTNNENNMFGGQGESSSVEEVVVPHVSPYNGTSDDEDQSTDGEEEADTGPDITEDGGRFGTKTPSFNNTTANYNGNSEGIFTQPSTPSLTDDDSDYSQENEPRKNHSSNMLNHDNSSTVKDGDLPTDIDDSYNPDKSSEPLITTDVYEDDNDSSSPPATISNRNNGITYDDDRQPSTNIIIKKGETDAVSYKHIEDLESNEMDNLYTKPGEIFENNSTYKSTTLRVVTDGPIEGPESNESDRSYTTPDEIFENNGTYKSTTLRVVTDGPIEGPESNESDRSYTTPDEIFENNSTYKSTTLRVVTDGPIEGPESNESDRSYTTPDEIFENNGTYKSTTIRVVTDGPIEGPKSNESDRSYTTPDEIFENNGTYKSTTLKVVTDRPIEGPESIESDRSYTTPDEIFENNGTYKSTTIRVVTDGSYEGPESNESDRTYTTPDEIFENNGTYKSTTIRVVTDGSYEGPESNESDRTYTTPDEIFENNGTYKSTTIRVVTDGSYEGPESNESDRSYTTPDEIFENNGTYKSTTIRVVTDGPIEGQKGNESDRTYTKAYEVFEINGSYKSTTIRVVPEDTTSYSSDATRKSDYYSTELPTDTPKINNSGNFSSTQEAISTETTEHVNQFNVVFKKRVDNSKETDELKELKIFPSSGLIEEQTQFKKTGSKGNCVNVGNLKFRNDVYSGTSILNNVLNRVSNFVNNNKEINTAVEDNSMWIYKMKSLKKERT